MQPRLKTLRVRSQTLKIFYLTFHPVRSGNDDSVEIDAPRLIKYMSFSDRIVVKNLNSLLKIDIDTDFNIKPLLLSEVLSKRDIIHEFLTGIASVTHMIISQPTLEVLYHYSKLGPFPKFYNLAHIQAAFSSSSLSLLLVFLESCSNLKSLILDFSVSTEPEQKMDLTKVPQCLISTLERVEINKLNMWEGPGMKLATYFIMNSAVLKKIKVVPMTVSGEEVPPQHQVFINYRGDELRKSFLGFVVKAMREAKINVFTDEVEVKGRDLQNLFRKIEESRVAVAILSERYTESSWCLDELVKMKEQMDQDKLVVIPIFYRLDATNCKRLVGTSGDNFRNLEREYRSEPERIKNWKEALISIPQKVGLTLAGHRDESELVDSIVKEVKKVLIDVSSKKRGQSTNHRTQTDIISSFEPLVAELDRLPSRLPQVFVSFCKEELGDNFVRHLVWALRELGVNVLMDSYNRRGKEDEQQQVFTSIEKSNIVLAIFSKRYSESDRCLNELVKMEELTKEGKLVVIPVFYNVKTNEVRRLQGEFGIHFADSLKRFSMEPMMVSLNPIPDDDGLMGLFRRV
ncbi:hypothetical protein Bca4012_043048 [Brassica carinata]